MKRREFLHVIGAAGAAATAGGCARGGGPSRIIPYVIPADNGVEPGVDVEYATVCRECPAGCGMVARARDGRLHKVEGNPDHPINRGKLCLRGHTALQGLYNPDRFQGPQARDSRGRLQPITWPEAERRLDDILAKAGAGRAAWIGPVETGPLDHLIDAWLGAANPGHVRLRYEPLSYDALRSASAAMFGAAGIPHFRIDRAHMLLSFGADFLETWVSNVEYTRGFSAWRQERLAGRRGRFVFIGPRLSMTGQNADEWVTIQPGSEGAIARGLLLAAAAAGRRGPMPRELLAPLATAAGVKVETIERLGREFMSNGPALALPPPALFSGPDDTAVMADVLRLNELGGAVGTTLIPGWPHALTAAAASDEMDTLAARITSGEVQTVFIQGVDLAYHRPASMAAALSKAGAVVSFSSYPDETTGMSGETGGFASLVLPSHTPLESWGDYTPRPGITGVLQPVVAPVFNTRPMGDVLLQSAVRRGHNLGAHTFEDYFHHSYGMDETAWEETLQRGGVFTAVKETRAIAPSAAPGLGPEGIVVPARAPTTAGINYATSIFAMPPAGTPTPAPASGQPAPGVPPELTQGSAEGQLYLLPFPSLKFFDGRTANRPWAQEIPDPTSKVVWGSWAEIHPSTAERLGVVNGSLLSLQTAQGKIEVPALLSPGIHPDVIGVEIGQGRTLSGRYASGFGVNVLSIMGPDRGGSAARSNGGASVSNPGAGGSRRTASAAPVTVRSLAAARPVVVLQTNTGQNQQAVARVRHIKDLTTAPPVRPFKSPGGPSLYSTVPPKQHRQSNRKWGMVIDLDRCVGCEACVAACYSENNISVVGKTLCQDGREMSWIRLETYGQAAPMAADPATSLVDTRFFPMVCQQCDNAPCEYVCPVDATMHDDEGLNEQVYNRCVGTKFCSNNCPYKVRRFNWFTFQLPYPLDQQLNPDVIQRKKGVMEKCSFCIQRIRRAEIDAGPDPVPIRDGAIQTACMQSCPADAIIFGDQHDSHSVVSSHFAADRRGYAALDQLNTFPNVQYLERLKVEAV